MLIDDPGPLPTTVGMRPRSSLMPVGGAIDSPTGASLSCRHPRLSPVKRGLSVEQVPVIVTRDRGWRYSLTQAQFIGQADAHQLASRTFRDLRQKDDFPGNLESGESLRGECA